MKKTIEYRNIKYKLIKIKYKNSNRINIIKGKCFQNPLNPSLDGAGCIIVHNIGVIFNKSYKNDNNYSTIFLPLHNIEEIFVIEKDIKAPIYLAWIGKNFKLPFDILTHINKFINGWDIEKKVYDLDYYKTKSHS